MATLESFASGSVVVTRNDARREIIITGGVLVINGVLDDLPGNGSGWTIRCRSGGGIRSTTGASGTLGGGVQSLKIIEQAAGSDGSLSWTASHTFGDDNWNKNNNGGVNARFAGDSTNRLKYSNIFWLVEHRTGRNDFDIARGTASNGSAGPSIELNGVRLIQRRATGTTQINFNHYGSRNASITINPNCGFGFSIRNETLSHAWEFSVAPGDGVTIEGLQSDDIAAADLPHGVDNGVVGARIACRIAANSTLTLDQLNTPDIACVDAPSTATLVLNNPVGLPTRTPNWTPQYSGNMIVNRDVPFEFSGATPTGHLYAVNQSASNGQDADIAIPSSGSATIRLRTNYSAHQATGGAWTSTDSYRFHAVGLHFAKYYSGTTNISVGNSPSTRSVALTAFTLPDGTAVSSKTSGAVSSAADVVNALKTYEVSNPAYPSLATRLVSFANSSEVQIATAELVLDTTASEFIARSSNTITLQCASAGVSASNDITLLNLGASYTPPGTTLGLIHLPTTSSAGTSALLNITAPVSYVGIYSNAGGQLAVRNYTAAGSHGFLIPASSAAANTRVGCARAGRTPQSRTLDLSAGGTFNIEFPALVEEVDAEGNALYDSSANKTGISLGFTTTGQATFGIPNRRVAVKELYRALHDQFSNPLGAKFPAFGRQNLGILDLGGAISNALFLGSDTQLRRASSSGDNAAVAAFVFGGIGGNKINSDRGGIETGASISTGGGGGATDLTEVNTKLDANKAVADVIRNQSKAVQTSLPLTFPEGSPLSPLCAVTGLFGQEVIRDVERRAYTITPSGVGIAEDLTGVHSFSGMNSHIDYSLRRVIDGSGVFFTNEIIVIMQAKPTTFNADDAQALFSIGAMLVSIAPSTGTTASLRVGVAGAQDSSAEITLDDWNTIVFSVQQRSASANYPTIRLAVNGGAQEIWNESSNQIFAQIGANTENFRLGARSVGNNLSSGWIGEARAIFMHPSNSFFNYDGATGWDIPADIEWDDDFQVYKGASLMDRTEGVAADVVEPILEDIDAKTHTLENIATAVLTQPSTAGQTASNDATASLIARQKWLAANVNTTTPESKEDIAAEVGARVIPNSPAAGSYDAALATASGYTIPTADQNATAVSGALTIPTAAQNATATWSATTGNNNVSGSMGARLQATSTHGQPADSPAATDVAKATWDYLTSATLVAGSFGEHLNALVNGPTAAAILTAFNDDEIESGVSRKKADQITLAVLGGTTSVAGDNVSYNSLTTGTPAVRLTQTLGATDGVRSAATLPSG